MIYYNKVFIIEQTIKNHSSLTIMKNKTKKKKQYKCDKYKQYT